jgi:hypothetical protein
LWQAIAAISFATISIAMIAEAEFLRPTAQIFQPIQFLAILLGAATAAGAADTRKMPRAVLALMGCVAVFPLAYAFGTSVNFWPAASRAGLFWLLPALLIVGGRELVWSRMLCIISLALLISTGSIYAAMEKPYRQADALRLQANVTEINVDRSTLLLSDAAADYIRELRLLSSQNGFNAGGFLLDLTGASPGSLYVIGARPLGAAWTLAGYPGSEEFLRRALEGERCDAIAASWILMEGSSPHAFPPNILRRFGIDLSSDYLDVGAIGAPRIASQQSEHHLLRPTRSREVAQAECERARK